MSDYADSVSLSGWVLGKRLCTSCEGYYRDVEDDLCSGCRGEYQTERYRIESAQRIRDAHAALLARAQASPSWRRSVAEAERLWTEYESKRTKGPKPGVSPLPMPTRGVR